MFKLGVFLLAVVAVSALPASQYRPLTPSLPTVDNQAVAATKPARRPQIEERPSNYEAQPEPEPEPLPAEIGSQPAATRPLPRPSQRARGSSSSLNRPARDLNETLHELLQNSEANNTLQYAWVFPLKHAQVVYVVQDAPTSGQHSITPQPSLVDRNEQDINIGSGRKFGEENALYFPLSSVDEDENKLQEVEHNDINSAIQGDFNQPVNPDTNQNSNQSNISDSNAFQVYNNRANHGHLNTLYEPPNFIPYNNNIDDHLGGGEINNNASSEINLDLPTFFNINQYHNQTIVQPSYGIDTGQSPLETIYNTTALGVHNSSQSNGTETFSDQPSFEGDFDKPEFFKLNYYHNDSSQPTFGTLRQPTFINRNDINYNETVNEDEHGQDRGNNEVSTNPSYTRQVYVTSKPLNINEIHFKLNENQDGHLGYENISGAFNNTNLNKPDNQAVLITSNNTFYNHSKSKGDESNIFPGSKISRITERNQTELELPLNQYIRQPVYDQARAYEEHGGIAINKSALREFYIQKLVLDYVAALQGDLEYKDENSYDANLVREMELLNETLIKNIDADIDNFTVILVQEMFSKNFENFLNHSKDSIKILTPKLLNLYQLYIQNHLNHNFAQFNQTEQVFEDNFTEKFNSGLSNEELALLCYAVETLKDDLTGFKNDFEFVIRNTIINQLNSKVNAKNISIQIVKDKNIEDFITHIYLQQLLSIVNDMLLNDENQANKQQSHENLLKFFQPTFNQSSCCSSLTNGGIGNVSSLCHNDDSSQISTNYNKLDFPSFRGFVNKISDMISRYYRNDSALQSFDEENNGTMDEFSQHYFTQKLVQNESDSYASSSAYISTAIEDEGALDNTTDYSMILDTLNFEENNISSNAENFADIDDETPLSQQYFIRQLYTQKLIHDQNLEGNGSLDNPIFDIDHGTQRNNNDNAILLNDTSTFNENIQSSQNVSSTNNNFDNETTDSEGRSYGTGELPLSQQYFAHQLYIQKLIHDQNLEGNNSFGISLPGSIVDEDHGANAEVLLKDTTEANNISSKAENNSTNQDLDEHLLSISDQNNSGTVNTTSYGTKPDSPTHDDYFAHQLYVQKLFHEYNITHGNETFKKFLDKVSNISSVNLNEQSLMENDLEHPVSLLENDTQHDIEMSNSISPMQRALYQLNALKFIFEYKLLENNVSDVGLSKSPGVENANRSENNETLLDNKYAFNTNVMVAVPKKTIGVDVRTVKHRGTYQNNGPSCIETIYVRCNPTSSTNVQATSTLNLTPSTGDMKNTNSNIDILKHNTINSNMLNNRFTTENYEGSSASKNITKPTEQNTHKVNFLQNSIKILNSSIENLSFDSNFSSRNFDQVSSTDLEDLKELQRLFTQLQTTRTNFNCGDKGNGFYADVDYNCKVFHRCAEGTKYTFVCSPGTLFHQEIQTCDFAFKVDCNAALQFYNVAQQQFL